MKKQKKPIFGIPVPKFSQLQIRAMERKRTARQVTPLLARLKRKEAMWEFKKKKELAEIKELKKKIVKLKVK